MNDIKPVKFEHKQNVTSEQVCANIRANAGRDLPSIKFDGVCVCGSGPSLAQNLEEIVKWRKRGFSIASMNGSYNYLVDNGIIPDYYFQVDARKGVNLPFLKNKNQYTWHIIASQCDPEIFDSLREYITYLWQVGNSSYEGAEAAIREIAPEATIFGGSCNVGHSSLKALVAMGYRIMRLYGFDGPTKTGESHAFEQPQNAADEKLEWFFEDERFVGSATSAHDAQAFVPLFRSLRDMGISIHVSGDDLLPRMVRAAHRNDVASIKPRIPNPIKRTQPVDKMRFVCWKWKGHIPYTAEHVNTLAAMIEARYDDPLEVVCITDDAEGINPRVRIIPMWRDHFEFGRDWHRLKIFSPEMIDIIGPRFVSMDLDTVICGNITKLFEGEAPFKAWSDPYRRNQYCTALFQMDAGAFPHVYKEFDQKTALMLRNSGMYTGYDQAWISHVLPFQDTWNGNDGVYSFKADIVRGDEIVPGMKYSLPGNAKVINFHGKYDPTNAEVQEACPWVKIFYRK